MNISSIKNSYDLKPFDFTGIRNTNVNNSNILEFKNNENSSIGNLSNSFKVDENSQQYKTDAQQLNEDAVWLSELYEGVQKGEEWAIAEARNLQVAADPDKNDSSANAQLLRSNNELAATIRGMIEDK